MSETHAPPEGEVAEPVVEAPQPEAPEAPEDAPLPTTAEQARLAALEDGMGAMAKAIASLAVSIGKGNAHQSIQISDTLNGLKEMLLARMDGVGGGGRQAMYARNPEPLTKEQRIELDKVDPLAWITEKTQHVWFVGRVYSMPIRQAWDNPFLGMKMAKLRTQAFGHASPWINCPFEFRGATPRDTETLQFQNQYWHRHRIDRRMGKDAFEGRDPLPEEVIVRPEDLAALDMLSDNLWDRPQGMKLQSSRIPLREYVRLLLQVHPQHLWFDTDKYFFKGSNHIARAFIEIMAPNPYGKGVAYAAVPPVTRIDDLDRDPADTPTPSREAAVAMLNRGGGPEAP